MDDDDTARTSDLLVSGWCVCVCVLAHAFERAPHHTGWEVSLLLLLMRAIFLSLCCFVVKSDYLSTDNQRVQVKNCSLALLDAGARHGMMMIFNSLKHDNNNPNQVKFDSDFFPLAFVNSLVYSLVYCNLEVTITVAAMNFLVRAEKQ